ncbi:MAG TPA: DUF2231 domain-containing protein [Acidobacteriota bacterium]|nr:DUF2231 domain-containing protein [Acidobacteriota bacterium]
MIRPRLFGHPLHPITVGFPVALWTVGLVWDLAALLRARPLWSEMAFWTLAAGLMAAVPALITGFWEMMALPQGHAAEGKVWWHMGIMSAAFCCILVSVLLRQEALSSGVQAPGSAFVTALAGVALTLAGGWLGGELVFGHGVGVENRKERNGDEPSLDDA